MNCTTLDIIGTTITLLAVIVALFGEKIRSSWFAPKLEVSLYDPKGEVNTITNGPKCRYYHLKATNSTNRNMAHNVTINIVKIEDIGSDGCVRLVCQGDVPFRWMYQELYRDQNNTLCHDVGVPAISDFFAITEDGQTTLYLQYYPNNLKAQWKGKFSIIISVVAKCNVSISKVVHYKISWDGIWAEGNEEMANHLVLQEI